MASRSYTSEIVRKVYDDQHGNHIYIGPDADGLDLVEVREVDDKNVILGRFVMNPIQAKMVGEALIAASNEKVITIPRP